MDGEGVSIVSQQEVGIAREKSIGNFCDELGINEDVLIGIVGDMEIQWTRLNQVSLVNGVVVELTKWLKKQRNSVKVICKVVHALFDVDELSENDQRRVQRRVERLLENESKLRKRVKSASRRRSTAKQEDELNVFERTLFDFQHQVQHEQQVDVDDGDTGVYMSVAATSGRDDEYESLLRENERMMGKLEMCRDENSSLKRELDDVRTKYKSELGKVGAFTREVIHLRKKCVNLEAENRKLAPALAEMMKERDGLKAFLLKSKRDIVKAEERRKELVKIRKELRDAGRATTSTTATTRTARTARTTRTARTAHTTHTARTTRTTRTAHTTRTARTTRTIRTARTTCTTATTGTTVTTGTTAATSGTTSTTATTGTTSSTATTGTTGTTRTAATSGTTSTTATTGTTSTTGTTGTTGTSSTSSTTSTTGTTCTTAITGTTTTCISATTGTTANTATTSTTDTCTTSSTGTDTCSSIGVQLKRVEGAFMHCKNKLTELSEKLRETKNELRHSKKERECNMEKIQELKSTKRRLQSCILRRKKVEDARKKKAEEEMKAKSHLVAGLRKQVRALKEELGDVEERPKTLKDKRAYASCVREVYMDLMSKYGVSTTKCEGVVRTVLEGLTHIDMENVELPKQSLAANMLLEARKIAQVQVARTLAEGQDLTVASDATTKFGHHYSSYDVYKESEDGSGPSAMTIGMRESEGGTAQTTLDTMLSILKEVSDMPGSTQTVNKIIANIKNTMSDRHVAEKKFNELLRDYRESILPDIVEGWDGMNKEEQTKFASMNNFYCGLHYLVGLANYSSTAIQEWERMVFGEDRVGTEAVSGDHEESGCGTVRLVRMVCKLVQDRGCEKSGKPLQFRSFLRTKGITSVPLAPFKGNRFNIMFHNGAGVFFLSKELKEFFEEHKDDIPMFRAVHADLGVNQYLAAVRALGLIDKLVTGPLWKVINEPGHIATMNEHYTSMHSCFERWSSDSSKFMCGEDVLFEGKHDPLDPILTALATPNPELDPMTKQVLELLFLTYCQVTKRMLEDHLPSGKHVEMGEEKVRETKSAPKTNVGVERDFGMLDRLIRMKPAASMMVMESIIMSVRNKTSEWRKGLSVTDREELMEYARKSVNTQRGEYSKRVKHLWDERAAKRKGQQEKAEELRERKRVRIESVYDTVVEKCGGIWMSENEMHERLQGESEKKCFEMLQAQLQARRHVLLEANAQGRLNVSEKGRKKSVLELKECLLEVIREASK